MKIAIMCLLVALSTAYQAAETVHNDPKTTTFNNALTPDLSHIYFTQVAADFSGIGIMYGLISQSGVIDVQPVIIDGIALQGTDVHISADGQRLLYSARNAFNSDEPMADYNLYVAHRTASGWSTPVALPEAINSASDEFYPSLTTQGDLYFARRIQGDNLDIFVSRLVKGIYQPAERLPDTVNSDILDGDPFISRDHRYLIFARMKPEGGLGMTDMFISYRTTDGWSEAENLGAEFNSPGIDGSPFISNDGKWLYFTSNRSGDNPQAFDNNLGLYRQAIIW